MCVRIYIYIYMDTHVLLVVAVPTSSFSSRSFLNSSKIILLRDSGSQPYASAWCPNARNVRHAYFSFKGWQNVFGTLGQEAARPKEGKSQTPVHVRKKNKLQLPRVQNFGRCRFNSGANRSKVQSGKARPAPGRLGLSSGTLNNDNRTNDRNNTFVFFCGI